MKPCPIAGCRQLIPRRSLVCRWHWKRLPGEARAELRVLYLTEPGSDRDHAAIAASLQYLTERQPQGTTA